MTLTHIYWLRFCWKIIFVFVIKTKHWSHYHLIFIQKLSQPCYKNRQTKQVSARCKQNKQTNKQTNKSCSFLYMHCTSPFPDKNFPSNNTLFEPPPEPELANLRNCCCYFEQGGYFDKIIWPLCPFPFPSPVSHPVTQLPRPVQCAPEWAWLSLPPMTQHIWMSRVQNRAGERTTFLRASNRHRCHRIWASSNHFVCFHSLLGSVIISTCIL